MSIIKLMFLVLPPGLEPELQAPQTRVLTNYTKVAKLLLRFERYPSLVDLCFPTTPTVANGAHTTTRTPDLYITFW